MPKVVLRMILTNKDLVDMTTECGQVQNYQEKTAHTKVRNEPSWTNRPSCRSPFHRMRRPVRPILPLPVGPSAEQGTKCCPTLRSVSFVVHRALRHSAGWDRSVQPIPTPLPVGPSAGAGGKGLVFNMKKKERTALQPGVRPQVQREERKARSPRRLPMGRGKPRSVFPT
jgi:hypothetical protein